MRITEQILGVMEYGTEREDVLFCADGMEQAEEIARLHCESGPFTLCRVQIIEVMREAL